MSNIKISDLEKITIININKDLIPIVDDSEDKTKSISIEQINSQLISGSNNFIPMFSGSNKLVNSKISHDTFSNLYTIDSSILVNNQSVFKGDTTFENGINLTNPNNILYNFITIGSERILFVSDTGEGLIFTSCQDDTPLTLKGWNGQTTLTIDEEEIRTNKKLNVNGNSTVNGSLTVTGMLTAETYHTEYVTSSVIYSSGSTKFGDTADDKHEFTGSLYVKGGGTFTDNINLYSSLRVDDETNLFGQFTAYSFSSFQNGVQCNNDVTIEGNLYSNAIANFNSGAIFNGLIELNSETYLNGDILTNVNIPSGTLHVGGIATFEAGLVTNNTSIFNDDITLNASLESIKITTSTITVNGTVTGSGFNKYITTSSLNSVSASLESHINSHTHTSFNNDLRITGSLIVSGGRVGIGTSIPTGSAVLHLSSNNQSLIIQQNTNASVFNGIEFMDYANLVDASIKFNQSTGEVRYFARSGGYYPTFYSNGVERMRMDISGKMGISMTPENSWGKLQIADNTFNAITITNGITNNVSKLAVITGAPYNNASKSFSGIGLQDNNISRSVYIGGGNWNLPDANEINFYTTPTYTQTDNQGTLKMKITGTGIDVSGSFRLNTRTISSSVQNGNAGEFCFDSNFAYFCIAPNTWKSASLS